MTYDKNHKEDLNSFFDDDSSAEDELLRVAEKLETMHGEKEAEMIPNVTLLSEIDLRTPLHSSILNRRQLSESISFEYPCNSSQSIATSERRGTAAKHVAATTPIDGKEHTEMRKEGNSNESGGRKRSVIFPKGGREDRRDKQTLNGQLLSENNDEAADNMSINGIQSEKNTDLMKWVVDDKKQKGAIVDLTKTGTKSVSRRYLGDNDSTTSDHEEETINSKIDPSCYTLSASSASSLSSDEAEVGEEIATALSYQNTKVEKLLDINQAHSSPQMRSQADSRNDPSISALPYAESTIRTNLSKLNTASINNSNGRIRNDCHEQMTGLSPPWELHMSKHVLRNPYLQRKSVAVVDSGEAESTLIDPQKALKSCAINKDKSKKTRSLTTECSDEIEVVSVKNRMKMKGGEMIIADSHGLGEEAVPEIPRSLCALPIDREGERSPILHLFDRHCQPLQSRQSTPVGSLDQLLTPRIVNSLWAQKFDFFNHFQSVMVNTLSRSDKSVVVSAPTGAGKSTLFELAMARFFSVDLRAQGCKAEVSSSFSSSSQISNARKILYIAPSKALCEERYEDWSRKFEHMKLGIEVVLVTGQDVGSEETTACFSDIIDAHLIVTTPEKWDSMTRRWNESFFLFASVKLLLLDEVHLLGDKSRGWCLESIIIRMKTIQRAASSLTTTPLEISTSSYTKTNPDALRSSLRTVAVSATLPNLLEVAEFLEAREAYSFDDSYRPVPLTKHVNSLGRVGNNEWRFWSNLSEHVPEIIKRFSHGKQALIFCHSKKETQKVAELLIRRNFGKQGVRKIDPPWNNPVEYMLSHGIGYHHAGMSKHERKKIEEAFLNKTITCLAATSTLAVGVNLPAHLVIVVGTKAWRNSEKGKGYQEIEVSALLQMIGRAGRLGLDSTGVAVVLTDDSSKKRIEGLLEAGVGPAKSNLVPRLPEVLNAEISQGVITCTDDILRWLQTTFLYCSLKPNDSTISILQSMGNEAMSHLRAIGVVESYDHHCIRPLAGSFIMNRRLVSFDQMKSIAGFPFNVSQCQILRSMSKLENFQSFVKRNEKRELKEFHKTDLMKYKLPGAISKFIVRDPSEKAFILLQSYLSRHSFENRMLNEEQFAVRDEAIKYLEAAQEYCVKASKHGKVALECYKLQRSLNYGLWGESSGVFNQFEWIGSSKTISNALQLNGIRSFGDVLEVSEQKLNEIFSRCRILDLPKNAGRVVKQTARDLCRCKLILSTDIEYTKNSKKPSDLICSLEFTDPTTVMTKEKREQDLKFSLIAYTNNSEDSSLIFEENICSPSTFRVPLPSYTFKTIYVHLLGTWVGFDQKKIIDCWASQVSSSVSLHLLQNSSGSNLPTNSRVETRKRRSPIGSTLRQREKRKYNVDIAAKKPSPVTPPPQHQKLGIYSSFTPATQPFCDENWEGSREATLPLTSSSSESWKRLKDNLTTITPNKMALPRGQTSYSIHTGETNCHEWPSKHSKETTATSMTKKGHSKISGSKHSHQQNDPSFRTAQALAGEFENDSTFNDRWTEQQSTRKPNIANRSSNSSYNSEDCPPWKNSTQEYRGKAVWNKSRTKQHRDQKRAFTEKKMNPFRTFSHDPNDFERHLEQLSQQSSIIPNPLLAKMKQSSVVRNRKSQHQFLVDRNHCGRAVLRCSKHNLELVLREKAFEQQFQHEEILSRRQEFSTSHPTNAWQQHHGKTFQINDRRPEYSPRYLISDERQSQRSNSPVSSTSLNLLEKEYRPEIYPTTPSCQSKPWVSSLNHLSKHSQFPQGAITHPSKENGHLLNIESSGSFGFDREDQWRQYQCLGRSHHQQRHQPSYSQHDFDSDF